MTAPVSAAGMPGTGPDGSTSVGAVDAGIMHGDPATQDGTPAEPPTGSLDEKAGAGPGARMPSAGSIGVLLPLPGHSRGTRRAHSPSLW